MRTEALAEDAVWTLGDETLAERDGRPIRARGDLAMLRLCGAVEPGIGSSMFSRLCRHLGMPSYFVGLQ